eukprot:421160_1
MQDDEKKEETTLNLNVNASITITRGYKLPLAKLKIDGTINDDQKVDNANTIVQRAIVFVIDRSYSMYGDRITMIKNALKPFIQEICCDKNTIIKLVLFSKTVETVNIPRDATAALSTIDKYVYASGGTDFHAASQGLVEVSMNILKEYPTYQLTVIMCSDGEVGKQNAEKGHLHWKEFVNKNYLKVHKIVPFVETIGISSEHDADVLSGFIVNDISGNYCKCLTIEEIGLAFSNAQNETMGRTATKLCIEFPINVCNDIYSNKHTFHLYDLIITNDEFKSIFWVNIDDFDNTTKGNDMNGLHLIINKQIIPITINEVINNEECQYEAIDFYNQVLKDMLYVLRNICDGEKLKIKAKEIENELNNDYNKIFELITSEPIEKQKLQNEIKKLLSVNNEIDIKYRADLMKKYKQMNRLWKKHRTVVTTFENTLSCVKTLVREIILGQVRMQEIRQHILDLHFRKTHARRISRLVLTDSQLAKRQEIYADIELPQKENCISITNEIGTGCYLSTLSKQECVLYGDPLWICGRVNRSGGASVSNPELINIEYISTDLVSDSYFKMALEAASNDEKDDEKIMNNNIGFADSSRQLINARIFPIYGNKTHFNATYPYIREMLSHTLSGRNDIHVVDYNALWTCLGYMICLNNLSTKNIIRILFEMRPSLKMLSDYVKCKPFKENSYAREPDTKANYLISLAKKKRIRISKFIQTFRARTTSWVSEVNTLFADKLMNLDMKFDHEFYLSAIMHRLRIMFNLQAPKHMNDMRKNKVEENHKQLLQILICGDGYDNMDEKEEKTSIKNKFDEMIKFKTNVYTNKILKKKKNIGIAHV